MPTYPTGGDMASTEILKLMTHAEDETHLVNNVSLLITGKQQSRKAANNAKLNRVALAA